MLYITTVLQLMFGVEDQEPGFPDELETSAR